MAKVAEQLADVVIVTSDNPRTENPDDIISDIVTGFEKPDSQAILIESNRKRAIELAIESADNDKKSARSHDGEQNDHHPDRTEKARDEVSGSKK